MQDVPPHNAFRCYSPYKGRSGVFLCLYDGPAYNVSLIKTEWKFLSIMCMRRLTATYATCRDAAAAHLPALKCQVMIDDWWVASARQVQQNKWSAADERISIKFRHFKCPAPRNYRQAIFSKSEVLTPVWCIRGHQMTGILERSWPLGSLSAKMFRMHKIHYCCE